MADANELLRDLPFECSVCMEMLDDTCKMLPCQHTFCKQCLETIFTKEGRLECPQCRKLVKVDIRQLPRNNFLLKVLEKVKSAQKRDSKIKQLVNEVKLLNIGHSSNSSVSSVERNTPVELPIDFESASIFIEDFNEVRQIMNGFLHLGIDEENRQFSNDMTQFTNMIDIEGALNSNDLKSYRSLVDYCLSILNQYLYHGQIRFLNRDPDNQRHVTMICSDRIENLDQVFKNICLNDADVFKNIPRESKLRFVIVGLVEIFTRFKGQIELRMALMMSKCIK